MATNCRIITGEINIISKLCKNYIIKHNKYDIENKSKNPADT